MILVSLLLHETHIHYDPHLVLNINIIEISICQIYVKFTYIVRPNRCLNASSATYPLSDNAFVCVNEQLLFKAFTICLDNMGYLCGIITFLTNFFTQFFFFGKGMRVFGHGNSVGHTCKCRRIVKTFLLNLASYSSNQY